MFANTGGHGKLGLRCSGKGRDLVPTYGETTGNIKMGDAINTPFDVFLFVLVFVGVPMLLFSLPMIVLVLLSERRYRALKKRKKEVEVGGTDGGRSTT